MLAITGTMISRATFTPIALASVLVTVLTAFWSFFALFSEFHFATWTFGSRPPLPPLTALLRAVYPFVWLLPLGALGFALLLGRRREISAVQTSWYVCSVAFLVFCWFLFVAVAFFCVYAGFGHYISPMEGG